MRQRFRTLHLLTGVALALGTAGCSGSSVLNKDASEPPLTAGLVIKPPIHRFTDAVAVSLDRFANAYVVDRAANTLTKLSPRGDSLAAAGGYGAEHYQFNAPQDVDARLTNNVLVADRLNHRVELYTKDLAYAGTAYTRQNADRAQQIGYPRSVAAEGGGSFYVVDGENKRVVKLRSNFTIERVIGGYDEASRAEGILVNPVQVIVDREERLLVLDNGGSAVTCYDNLGNVLARRALSSAARAIACSNDTVFVLNSEKSDVLLLRGPLLTPIARWSFAPEDRGGVLRAQLDGTAQRFVEQNGAWFLLTTHALYPCTIISTGMQ